MKSINIISRFCLLPFAIACNMSIAKQNELPVQKQTSDSGFAVLELFTSEGCSSCPAADAVLEKLLEEYDGKVFALGFHVDYWDRLGWTDSFSSAAYSKRQEKYAVLFHLNSIYTPQVVINGKNEMVGSDGSNIKHTILKELQAAATQTITLQTKTVSEKNISVSYTINKTANAVLNIALVQLHAETAVKRGENGGRTLKHINVVRDFKTIQANELLEGRINLDIPEGLSARDCKVIAYLQDANDFHVKAGVEALLQ
ncbi:hypothetical protein BH10BAC2_BH10BAC2_22110 [soil metagenome]